MRLILSGEFITETVSRLNKLRIARIFFEFLPESGDVNVNRSNGWHCVVTSNFI